MAVAFDEPLGVVALDERRDLSLSVREIHEAVQPQALLLQRPHETLDHAVALRLPDERRRVLDAEPPQLRAKGVRRVLRPPGRADADPAGYVLAHPAERVPHALVERLQRRPPITPLGRLPP